MKKFRVFDIELKEYLYWSILEQIPKTLTEKYVLENLEQSLEVEDKNGREIFEGDVTSEGLKVTYSNSECSYRVGKYWATKQYLSTCETSEPKIEPQIEFKNELTQELDEKLDDILNALNLVQEEPS